MRVVHVTTPGGPKVMSIRVVEDQTPGPGQVRIRVEAAAVNPVDLQTRTGIYHQLGWVAESAVGLGWDVAGVVDAVGPGVEGLAIGTPVAALSAGVDRPYGAYADAILVSAVDVAVRPEGLDAVSAATVPLNATTASQALDLLGAPAGRALLVTGAAGAVGGYAAQLAAERGFQVTGLARPADAEFVASIGAQIVTGLPAGPAYDAVVDAAALGSAALAAVVADSHYVGVIPPAKPVPERGITVSAVMVQPDGPLLAEFLERTASGEMPARLHSTIPLEQAAEAHRLLERGGLRGRIVLVP